MDKELCAVDFVATETSGSSNQDLFGGSLIGDLMDAPALVLSDYTTANNNPSEVDLFADATFVSAPPPVETSRNSQAEVRILFKCVASLCVV